MRDSNELLRWLHMMPWASAANLEQVLQGNHQPGTVKSLRQRLGSLKDGGTQATADAPVDLHLRRSRPEVRSGPWSHGTRSIWAYTLPPFPRLCGPSARSVMAGGGRDKGDPAADGAYRSML